MADNVFEVTAFQQYQGQTLLNVVHFSGPSSDPAQMSQLATEFSDTWVTHVRSQQVQDLKYVAVKVQLLESQFAAFTLPLSVNGNSGGNNNDKTTYCHIIRKRSALIGKHGQGRAYIGGIANNADQLSFLDQGRITAWTTRLASIMAVFGPGGSSTFRIGITRKVQPAANFLELVTMQIAPQYGLQRRRMVGRGI